MSAEETQSGAEDGLDLPNRSGRDWVVSEQAIDRTPGVQGNLVAGPSLSEEAAEKYWSRSGFAE